MLICFKCVIYTAIVRLTSVYALLSGMFNCTQNLGRNCMCVDMVGSMDGSI